MSTPPRRPVLLANELGHGLGHLSKLIPVGQALAARGFSPVLAVRHPIEARHLPHGWHFPVLGSPALPASEAPTKPRALSSMAGILARVGFARSESLRETVLGWESVVAQVRPSLVVTDFAPFLQLAVLGRVPVVALGTGFTLPPPGGMRFPAFRAAETDRDDDDDEVEHQAIMAAVLELQSHLRRPAPATMPALLAGSRHFVCVVAALDPYRSIREIPAAGPLERPPCAPDEDGSAPQLFAYLAADAPSCPSILAGLGGSGLLGRVYLRGGSPPRLVTDAGARLQAIPRAIPIDAALATATVVVHHGGLNTAQRAALAGRPQLVLSCCVEQALTGAALEALGIGQLLRSAQHTPEQIAAALRALAADAGAASQARTTGATLRGQYPRGALPDVLEACLWLAT